MLLVSGTTDAAGWAAATAWAWATAMVPTGMDETLLGATKFIKRTIAET